MWFAWLLALSYFWVTLQAQFALSLSLSRLSALPLLKLVCDKILKFIPKFTLFWVAFSAFLVILSICVNFYYFRTYHTKIDTFIFTLKDDETTAILQIIWQDYPVVPILLIIFLYTFLLYKISKKFLTLNLARNSIQTDHKTSITKKNFFDNFAKFCPYCCRFYRRKR